VEQSFDDYRSNRDPVLDAALGFSGEGMVLDPIGYLKELFMAKKLDELKAEAVKMVADPRYRFINFENEFNQNGYNLLNSGQMEAALYVFQLNTDLFPESANTWDSLGEACWKAGKKDNAIEYYKKAIALDPNGGVGQNARNMLKQLVGE